MSERRKEVQWLETFNPGGVACVSVRPVSCFCGMVHVHPAILLIDDHDDVRDGLEVVLRREGYAVETAANGREALNKLCGGLRPCIILMDLMMPVMTGYEFRQEQLAYPEFRDIPLIVYSGVTDVHENARHLQAAAYAEKPIELDRLMGLVRQHCLK